MPLLATILWLVMAPLTFNVQTDSRSSCGWKLPPDSERCGEPGFERTNAMTVLGDALWIGSAASVGVGWHRGRRLPTAAVACLPVGLGLQCVAIFVYFVLG